MRLGTPDPKSQSFRFAELSFLPDSLEGTEYIVFNQTQVKYQELKKFLSTWHRLQVLYDLNAYAGILLLDGQVILKDLPLQVGPWVDSRAEVSISSDKEMAAAVWVDDLELKIQDAGFKPQDTSGEELYLIPVAKEGFEEYKIAEFPLYGGWVTSPELVAEGGALPVVDNYEYASGMQSLRLKSGDDGAALIVKRFSLPERFPFDLSDGNFAITNETQVSATRVTAVEAGQRASGARAEERARARERLSRRQKAVISAPSEELVTTSKESAQAIPARAATDAKTQTLSAMASGGSFYIYSYDGRLLAEYNRLDQPVKDYIYIGNQLLAEYKPQESRMYFYTPDQINSTRIVTDESGTVVYSAAHDPYGGIQKTWVNTYDPTPKFSGKERDAESGLDYFGARYYDKAQYRFISADPVINTDQYILNPQRMHLFSYCMNNPTSFLDPDGKILIPVVLPALNGKTLNTYMDSSVASKFADFIGICNMLGINITFDNAYRTQAKQDAIKASDPNAAVYSLHSAGFAADVNWASLSSMEQNLVVWAANISGLSWGGNIFNNFYDKVHFQQDVASKDLAALIDAASFMYRLYELGPMELYMLYGVFNSTAAEQVILSAIEQVLKDKQ
jgi:RHS repeat-associated protein